MIIDRKDLARGTVSRECNFQLLFIKVETSYREKYTLSMQCRGKLLRVLQEGITYK